jgi:hypothetical protein
MFVNKQPFHFIRFFFPHYQSPPFILNIPFAKFRCAF